MKTIRIYLSGTVQGVFFRAFLKEKALELGLKGFTRNLEDGRVEVVVEGEIDKVAEFLEICKRGPKHANISMIEDEEITHQGFSEFKVLRI